MHDAVTFHVDVADMFGRKEAERLDFSGAYVDIPDISGIIVHPYIFLVVTGDGSVPDIQFGITA